MNAAIAICSIFLFLFSLVADSDARAGKGKSSGFRNYDSQKYSPTAPQKPSQDLSRPAPIAPAKPSFFNSGLFKTLVGGLFIGALLSMLMGSGFQFGAPGLLEILIIAGLLFFLYRRFVQKKQSEAMQYAGSPSSHQGYAPPPPHPQTDAGSGVESSVNEQFLSDLAKSTFKAIQDAWSKGDLSSVRNIVTDRMYSYLSQQMDDLKSKGLRDNVEITFFQNVGIVEVAEEGDKKLVVMLIEALVRDYTVDRNNTVVEGSKDVPTDVREYWAFVGKGLDWKLDDIRQAA